MKIFTLTLALAAASLLGGASTARADTNCTRTLGGAAMVTTVNGNITVPKGASCTISFANISGNISVSQDTRPWLSTLTTSRPRSAAISKAITANRCYSKAM